MTKPMVRYLIAVVREPGKLWSEYPGARSSVRNGLERRSFVWRAAGGRLFPTQSGKTVVVEILAFAGRELRQWGHIQDAQIVEGLVL